MTHRVHNFSPGPAVLPESVLMQVQRDLLALPGVGMSVLEITHRGPAFTEILQSTKDRLRRLLHIPENYQILFLQGGSRLQFSMIPMNLLRGTNRSADYVLTGSWGLKAHEEAVREGSIRVAWDGKSSGYNRFPDDAEWQVDPQAAYVYVTSNETIEGVQFAREPVTGEVPLVCDASSDFLCRPVPIARYGLIYACAQKNAGPAGVTIVIVRDDLLDRSRKDLPGYLNYRAHAKEDSLFNTPPTFAIYLVNLVAGWLLDEIGGLEAMHQQNRRKADLLYRTIDESNGFYSGHAQPASRSMMNVTFRLPNDELQSQFLKLAEQQELVNLAGHRSVGGIRASIYNAMPVASVERLRDFMCEFLQNQRS